jgi:hypothetical protein
MIFLPAIGRYLVPMQSRVFFPQKGVFSTQKKRKKAKLSNFFPKKHIMPMYSMVPIAKYSCKQVHSSIAEGNYSA